MDVVMSGWESSLAEPDAVIQLSSQVIKLFMALAAIYVVWRGREYDLNELRARVRIWFISSLVLTVLAVAIKEFFYIFSLTRPSQVVGIAWMFLLALLGNLAFIKLNPQVLLVRQPVAPAPPEDLHDPVIVRLLERMVTERLYADHDLRVGSLADLMGVPEYQLRRKINKNLGYQNFNQFVNHYRIKEAGERLLSEPRTPVLSIALDVGFRSISSFNTAFQRKFAVSPTEYRADSLSNN
jgi:AraC-like DNA-binding protein